MMKYTRGKVGKVYIAKIEHGDDLLEELKRLAEQERLEAGIFYVIGALKKASMVTGPEECTRPPAPVWREFGDCREILGIGTLFREEGVPVFHLHGAAGKGDTTLVGCIRGGSEFYLVAEVIIIELLDTGAFRKFDKELGVKLLNILPG